MKKPFKIAHLTDMHIGAHSDDAWRALTLAIDKSNPDLIVISGDLSESNSASDMENACTWITGEIKSRASLPSFGLNCGEKYRDKVVVVPGNHDYFYGDTVRLQRSKTSDLNDLQFSRVFDVENYPNWRFVDRGGSPGVFIVSIDTAKELSIANGIVEKSVLEKIRKWGDKARHGILHNDLELLGINGLSKNDAVNKYRKAYKVLVLHHYIMSPNIVGNQPFMTLDNSHELLGQITADNFDLVLSGHDHLGFVDSGSYASVLDPRAMTRFARMHCVRRLGLKKPPVYEVDENNRMLSKPKRIAIDFWNRIISKGEDKIKQIHRNDGVTPVKRTVRRGYNEFVKYDLKNRETKKILNKMAEKIENEMEDILNDRNIVNAIGYSATSDSEETKGFFMFEINDDAERASEISSSRWIYNPMKLEFEEKPSRNLSISQPLDLFESELFQLMKDAGIDVGR